MKNSICMLVWEPFRTLTIATSAFLFLARTLVPSAATVFVCVSSLDQYIPQKTEYSVCRNDKMCQEAVLNMLIVKLSLHKGQANWDRLKLHQLSCSHFGVKSWKKQAANSPVIPHYSQRDVCLFGANLWMSGICCFMPGIMKIFRRTPNPPHSTPSSDKAQLG